MAKVRVARARVGALKNVGACSAAAFALALGAHAAPPTGAAPVAAAPPSAAAQDEAPAKRAPEPIPLSEVSTRAEEALATVREVQEGLTTDRTADQVTWDLRTLTREMDVRIGELRKVLSRSSSIDTLRRLELPWTRLGRTLAGWSRTLGDRVEELEHERDRLDALEATWRVTLDEARKGAAPPELLRRVEALLVEIRRASEAVAREHSRALAVQTRVGAQQARISDVVAATRRARQDVEDRLLLRDGPPIWAPGARRGEGPGLAQEAPASLGTQWQAVQAYTQREPGRFLFHGIVFLLLAALLYWGKRRLQPWVERDPALKPSEDVFEYPIAMALVLSIFGGGFRIYPDAPIMWFAILGALVLVPAVVILRRFMDRDLWPVLYALVLFYLVDQLRSIAAPLALLPRLLFLSELVAAALVAVWMMFRMRKPPPGQAESSRRRKYVRRGAYFAFIAAVSAAGANALGYIALSAVLGNALFYGAYMALMLFAVVEILDGLARIALSIRPCSLLGSVRNHRVLMARRIRIFLDWTALVLWTLFMLQRLTLRERLFETAHAWLTEEFSIGSIHITAGDVVAFALVIWASFLVSRFVRFLLEEEVFPRFSLGRGLPYAISTTIHYALVVVGFFFAVGALGLDMTKFTILAGAFTVGVGFGLQNIFNNFVSGLILLFERPIKVGDVIQIDDVQGVVQRIGIRASIVRASAGPELIVPNAKLISERVSNWTFYGRQRTVEVPIAVVSAADVGKALGILERIGAGHEAVLKTPAPKAYVVRMGPDWWGLELCVWTDRPESWIEIRSALAVAAGEALRTEGIAVK